VTKRAKIIATQDAGELVNRLNGFWKEGWKLQDGAVLACTRQCMDGSFEAGVLVPTYVYVLYKENNTE
jgi:hypothetical protein